MGRAEQWRRAARAHPMVVDALLGAALFAVVLLPVNPPGGPPREPLTTSAVLLALAGCAALTFRRRYPLPVLAVVSVAAAVSLLLRQTQGPLVLTVALAAYTVATRADRRTAVRTTSR